MGRNYSQKRQKVIFSVTVKKHFQENNKKEENGRNNQRRIIKLFKIHG